MNGKRLVIALYFHCSSLISFKMKYLPALLPLVVFIIGSSECAQINVDTSRTPDLRDFGGRVKKALENWYPFIAKFLYSPTFRDIPTVTVTLDPGYPGVAFAQGFRIVGSGNYYRSHQDDLGSMIHELTHVIQGYNNGPGWLVEGIADYVRFYKYEPRQKPSKPGPGQRYTDGYRVTAYFLNYVVTKVKGDMIYWLNKNCREGTYNDAIWPRLTGKSLDILWADMMRSG